MNKHKPVQQGLLFLMRVSLIQMLITFFTMAMVYAVPTMGQEVLDTKITLNVEATEFQEVLKLIGKQARVKFAYSPELVEEGKKISLHVENIRLADVLPDLLNPQVSFKVIGKQIVLVPRIGEVASSVSGTSGSPASVFTITGRVTDPVGTSLPGVNVLIKGTTTGTSTDADGLYKLDMPDGLQTLVFSFIGYATEEIPVNNRTTLDVVMAEDLATLNEVVVIGYGTQERKEVTNAVTQLNGAEVLESKSASVSNSLSGKVPGMIINQRSSRPGADGAQIYVRGVSTFGDAGALIVVDGVANRDGIDRIDPNDIESVTVLKDASAAIYGAQSANGVILITTKRGKTGKPTINYSYNHGFVSPVRLMKMSNASTYARGVNDLNDQAGTARTYSDAQLAAFDNGQSPSTDWFGEVYRDYFTQSRHSLTVSGGNDVAKYFLSGGLLSQGSILTNDEISKYKQYNFRSNVDVQVTKRLSIGLDVAGRRQNTNSPYLTLNTLYQNAVAAAPNVPATINGLPTAGRSNSNPLAVVGGPGYDRTQYDLVNGTVRFKYEIPHVEGLSIDGFGAIDSWTSFRKQFDYPWTYVGTDGAVIVSPISTKSLAQIEERNTSTTLNAKLNYQRTFNDIHSLTAFVAAERNQTRYDYLQAQRSGFMSAEIDELFAGAPSTQTVTGRAEETARMNYFGRLGYTLMDRYMVQFQFRSDGSFRFPDGKRWGFFPGASLGWVLSEEEFMKSINVLSYLKIRASYGILGNDRIGAFQYLNQYVIPTTAGTGYVIGGGNTNVINPTLVANPEVTWEKKKTFDIGLEGRLFQDKISFEVDYFNMRTSDILWQRNVTVPTYTGLNSTNLPAENIGIVDNKGIDGQIAYRKSINSDLSFNIGVNMTYAKNTLVYWDEPTQPETYLKFEGKPIGAMRLYEFAGIYRTQEDLDRYPGLNAATGSVARLGDAYYRDVNGDGKVDSNDRVTSNYSNTPQIQYGILFGAKYKNFDLSGNFMGQARAIVQYDYVFNLGSNAAEYYVQNAWSPSNPNGSLPRIGRSKADASQGSTLNTRSVAFLRLKNIELGYNLPKDLVSRIGMERARIYVNGYNLLTFDKLKKDGLQDPEEINPQGWQFPQTKSVNMGVSVTF